MRVVVTGAAGLLGAAVCREFERSADVIALDHAALDVADDSAVTKTMESLRPDALINCAAYNNVDGAEDAPMDALRVNAFGTLTLARAAARQGASFVHYSTDFVFDGETSTPYTEEDAPNPRGVYAASKLLGDWFALDAAQAWVLRVESLFGTPAPGAARVGSLGTIVERLRAGEEIPVFGDRTVSPSYTADVAHATREILDRRPAPGLYHCVNTGAATWAEIAETAARLLGLSARLKPITLETAALRAPRPRFCALANAKLAAAGIPMPTWQDALARHLRARSGGQ